MGVCISVDKHKRRGGEEEEDNEEEAGVDFLAFPPINIGESYKKWKGLRKVISQSNSSFATLHLICPDI